MLSNPVITLDDSTQRERKGLSYMELFLCNQCFVNVVIDKVNLSRKVDSFFDRLMRPVQIDMICNLLWTTDFAHMLIADGY